MQSVSGGAKNEAPDAPQEPTLHRIINMASVFGIVDIERVLGSFSKSVRLLEANRLQLSPWIGAFGDRCAVASDEVRVHVVAGQRELLLVGADVATVLCCVDLIISAGQRPQQVVFIQAIPVFPVKVRGIATASEKIRLEDFRGLLVSHYAATTVKMQKTIIRLRFQI